LNYKADPLKFSKLLRKFKKREKEKEDMGPNTDISIMPEM